MFCRRFQREIYSQSLCCLLSRESKIQQVLPADNARFCWYFPTVSITHIQDLLWSLTSTHAVLWSVTSTHAVLSSVSSTHAVLWSVSSTNAVLLVAKGTSHPASLVSKEGSLCGPFIANNVTFSISCPRAVGVSRLESELQ